MNRSILIVICDFLLVTLLAFSSVDINQVSQDGVARPVKLDQTTNQADGGKDLAAVMKLALEEERRNREQLLGELQQTRLTAEQRAELARTLQQDLQSREQEAQRLQQTQTGLQQQFSQAQSNIQTLNQQLQSSSTEALLSKEKLAALEADARKQSDQAAALQQQLAELAKSNQVVLTEKQRLAGQLQVAEVEKRAATEQATRMQEEVKVEREEKAKLAEGVKALASRSGELAQEVRDNRPLAPNTIFNEFLSNRVEASIQLYRSGIMGLDMNRRKQTETVLFHDGTNIFALCHVQDTPLLLGNPGTDWERITGTLGRTTSATFVSIKSLSFCSVDPRVVLIPVTEADARELKSTPYRTSSDPYKFQDAVLIGAQEGYYGECKFQIDQSTPDYVKLDRSFLKGLFGKFNPSRGDLVFSKTGELLGVMANDTYCMMIRHLDPAATFQFGPDVRAEHTGDTLARLYSAVTAMPTKLQ